MSSKATTTRSCPYIEPLDPNLARMLRQHDFVQVRRGGEILQHGPPPNSNKRRCQDRAWAILFWLVFTMSSAGAVVNNYQLTWFVHSWLAEDAWEAKELATVILFMRLDFAAIAGSASLVTSFAILHAIYKAPRLVVMSVILLGMVAVVLVGFAVMATQFSTTGLLIVCFGLIAALRLWCWRALVPFTIEILLVVNRAIMLHPTLLIIQFLGSLMHCFIIGVCARNIAAVCRVLEDFNTSAENQFVLPLYGLMLVILATSIWTFNAIGGTCYLAACGVYCRWYHAKASSRLPGRTRDSLRVACTTSFGSVCYFSAFGVLIDWIRILCSIVQRNSQEEHSRENFLITALAGVKEMIIACVGDTIEWFNKFAFVQCAKRGYRLVDAVAATYALCTLSSMEAIREDNIVSTVCFIAAWVCCLMGGLVGAAWGCYEQGNPVQECFVVGCVFGWLVGRQALLTLDSGATTIIMCWSEDAAVLGYSYPKLHMEFCLRAECWQTEELGYFTGHSLHSSSQASTVEMRII